MGLREDIQDGLMGYGVYSVEVDRTGYWENERETKVVILEVQQDEPHQFSFEKTTVSSGAEIAAAIRTYLEELYDSTIEE